MPPRRRIAPKSSGPDDLQPTGKALWKDLHAGSTKFPAEVDTLALEACRIADRLDRLSRIIDGHQAEWLWLKDGTEVRIDSVLGEARQQAMALRALVAEIRKVTPAEQPKEAGDAVDEIKRRREQRQAQAEY